MSDLKQQALNYLHQLGQKVGINDLSFNDDQVCRLVLDKTLIVDLEYSNNDSALYAICTVASRLPESDYIYKHLLSANLFGRGTGSAVLAYDDEKDEVILYERFDLAVVPAEAFVDRIEQFVGYADHWTQELLKLGDEESDNLDDDLPSSGDSVIRV